MRIGVLGCAEIARRRILPALAATDGIEIAAVASRDPAKAEETARRFETRAVHGYDRLLARDDIDAVYLPLPAALHAQWTQAALRAGKHVLAEKPMTTDRDRTEQLLALARASGLFLMENVMFVRHSQHATVQALLADGAIGELRSFRAEFAIPRLAADDIRYRADLGGGALWDTGVYPVRAALHFLGDGLRVVGATLAAGAGYSVDTSGAALLQRPDGVSAHLAFGLDHAYRSSYELCGSAGRITVDRAFTPPSDFVPRIRLERRSGADPLCEDIRIPPDDQVKRTIGAFADAVRSGAVPDDVSLRQAALLHDIRRMARRA